jgi:1-acyl-sn-glycerol-3-phosphate acyltransferase
MRYHLSKFILKIFGWNIIGGIPDHIKKAVVIVAPHTSWWDFVWGRLAYNVMGVKVKFLIKKEAFRFPIARLLRRLGGIPVDRRRSANMVESIVRLFHQEESFFITITPEGTRKYNPNWKKGFYYIAVKANVPIALGVLDYKKKEGGVPQFFYPTGDLEKDFKVIEDFYRGRGAKYPENFNLS